jgi:hypothetical protein
MSDCNAYTDLTVLEAADESFLKILEESYYRECPKGSLMVSCPAHDDSNPSLHVSLSEAGDKILLKCFAGCTTDAVLRAWNVGWAALYCDGTVRSLDPHRPRIIRPPAPPRPRIPKQLDDSEADYRHSAYSELVKHLSLRTQHREDLHLRGLTDADIARFEYRSIPGYAPPNYSDSIELPPVLQFSFEMDALIKVPGFVRKKMEYYARNGDNHPKKDWFPRFKSPHGIFLPLRDVAGRIIGCQIRSYLIGGSKHFGGGKYYWPAGTTAYPHVPRGRSRPRWSASSRASSRPTSPRPWTRGTSRRWACSSATPGRPYPSSRRSGPGR